MPGLQADGVVAALGSPIKKSRLSLKFFQKKETKRALDFSDTHVEEQNTQPLEAEEPTSCDQVVPAPCPTSPPTCERKENLVPFVGLNNLGNTCYLNSILQVLYYCPGFKEAIKKLYKLSKYRDKLKETAKNEYGPQPEGTEGGEEVPAPVELLGSFYSLITSVEQLQSSFLLQPNKYNEGELATPPRLLLNSLRQLNPMYEGYLQHDAQEVLQCILGYVEEACETICKEKQSESSGKAEVSNPLKTPPEEEHGADGQLCGKRKSDTEAGNAKKKPKSQSKSRGTDDITTDQEQQPLTRSKRKSSGDITTEGALEAPLKDAAHEREIAKESEKEKEGVSDTEEGKTEKGPRENGKRKKRARLGWLKTSSVKQPSIFSKFRSMGRLSSTTSTQAESKENDGRGGTACEKTVDSATTSSHQEQHEPKDLSKSQSEEVQTFDALKRLFQGQLVLRTRCLECECFTERREDFQDISVPVQEDGPAPRETSSEVSPEPKAEVKTLRWAISQFASVERIVGEDKYFCETCHHYTEAERSLLFDKTPEVITIHLKCFAANTSEMDPYAGLSKVNTPLQTPLQLSLEEWSTGAAPRGQQYQLFAVVMHSGITISSGHYTTYIRMSDLHKINIKEKGFDEEERTKEFQTPKREMMGSGMANGAGQDYDDGEVSFSLNGRCMSTTPIGPALPGAKGAGKKTLEGVALLGGQRSLTTTYELGSGGVKQAQQQGPGMDKSGFSASSQALSSNGSCGAVKQERDTMAIAETGEQACQGSDPTLLNLLDYEGKWLLFDDSEVRLFEEEDFLRACSPETCSTSTPYLLFYRKVEGQK